MDPRTGSTYIASVRKRKILRRLKDRTAAVRPSLLDPADDEELQEVPYEAIRVGLPISGHDHPRK